MTAIYVVVMFVVGIIVFLISLDRSFVHDVKTFRSAKAGERERIIDRLKTFPFPIVPRLLNTLRHKDPLVRSGSAELLGMFGDIRAEDALIKALRDQQPEVKHEVITALGLLKSKRAYYDLLAIFEETDKEARRRTIEAFGHIGTQRTLDVILQALNDEDTVVRKNAVDAFANIPGVPQLTPLVDMLEDPHPDVRMRAAIVLKMLGWFPGTDQERVLHEIARQNWDADILSTSAAVESLLNTLRENSAENTRARVNAITALGKIGDIRAVPALIHISEHEDTHVLRELAVTALGEIGHIRALKPLINMLHDNNPALRLASANALGSMRQHDQAMLALMKALGIAYQKEKNLDVQKAIVSALGNLGDHRTKKIFVYALKYDDDAEVRFQAAHELDKLGWKPHTAREKIAYHIASSNWEALDHFGALAIPQLIRLSKIDRDREVRAQAAETLKNLLAEVDTIIFGRQTFKEIPLKTSLRNVDVTELTMPFTALKRIVIDADSYDFYQVERFLTYAINYIGQKRLKAHVVVNIYGDAGKFNANLRNNFENFCKQVEICE